MIARARALVALVALAAVVLAGTGVDAQQAQPQAPTPAAAPTRADTAALRLLERSAAAYQGARTLRAEFTQRISNPRTRTAFESVGEFFQRGATHFAFKFSKPPEDRIVSDGEVLWLYSPSTARGQVYKLPRGAGAGMDLASSVLKDPARRYTVTAGADTVIDGRAVRAVVLVPKAQGMAFMRAVLWLDVQNALVRRAEFAEATGATRTLEFRNIRTGASLPRDAFVFVPPAGVRVIDQAAMMGGSTRP
ncbi:MAG: outer membrane lipoprotein carrier protein LolA [Gemmatimonadetes bacterium]|nr:outer membrane lipoprotein carrier protein LolA [Gemmatimonadota bacterium]